MWCEAAGDVGEGSPTEWRERLTGTNCRCSTQCATEHAQCRGESHV